MLGLRAAGGWGGAASLAARVRAGWLRVASAALRWTEGGGLGGRMRDGLCVLQRLKDEIAEVANEIENLGSTEER